MDRKYIKNTQAFLAPLPELIIKPLPLISVKMEMALLYPKVNVFNDGGKYSHSEYFINKTLY